MLISLALALLSCSGDEVESPSAPPEPTIEELEAKVIENCTLLRDALVEYKDDNNGWCPSDIYSDTNDVGLTVIDCLPGGELLENPFTGERTEPSVALAAEPGQIGYHPLFGWGGTVYYISGFGGSYIIVEMSNVDEIEPTVIANCLLVQQAAEMFASLNGGVYPCNVNVDTTPEGETLVDLLPDGTLLQNPVHLAATEPIDGASCNPGETGYVPVFQGGSSVGYVITGTGVSAGYTIFTWYSAAGDTCISINGVETYCTY